MVFTRDSTSNDSDLDELGTCRALLAVPDSQTTGGRNRGRDLGRTASGRRPWVSLAPPAYFVPCSMNISVFHLRQRLTATLRNARWKWTLKTDLTRTDRQKDRLSRTKGSRRRMSLGLFSSSMTTQLMLLVICPRGCSTSAQSPRISNTRMAPHSSTAMPTKPTRLRPTTDTENAGWQHCQRLSCSFPASPGLRSCLSKGPTPPSTSSLVSVAGGRAGQGSVKSSGHSTRTKREAIESTQPFGF